MNEKQLINSFKQFKNKIDQLIINPKVEYPFKASNIIQILKDFISSIKDNLISEQLYNQLLENINSLNSLRKNEKEFYKHTNIILNEILNIYIRIYYQIIENIKNDNKENIEKIGLICQKLLDVTDFFKNCNIGSSKNRNGLKEIIRIIIEDRDNYSKNMDTMNIQIDLFFNTIQDIIKPQQHSQAA